jgi:hypothetical protein
VGLVSVLESAELTQRTRLLTDAVAYADFLLTNASSDEPIERGPTDRGPSLRSASSW